MSHASRRRSDRSHPRVEALEARALMAVAGSLDATFFGGYGSSTVSIGTPIQSSTRVTANSVLTTPDGHILAVGSTEIYPSTNLLQMKGSTSILEFNANGTLNTSFGIGGQVQLLVGGPVTVASDGGIIVASINSVSNSYGVVRLNPNGSFDTTFGTNGVASYPTDSTIPTNDRLDYTTDVVALANDQILVTGSSDQGMSAVRLNSDGSLDTTFGQGGTANVTPPSGFINGNVYAATQANGQIILASTTEFASGLFLYLAEVTVARLNADGTLDTSYGGSTAAGIVTIPAKLSNSIQNLDQTEGVAIEPTTGDVLVAGNAGTSNTLYRLNTDGTLDTTFGTGGVVTVGPITSGYVKSIAVEANGNIVLGGSADFILPGGADTVSLSVIYQLNPDGTPDTSFGNTSTPGLLQTSLSSTLTLGSGFSAPAINPTNGNILAVGVSPVPSIAGLTYGLTVDSILAAATTGPAARASKPAPPADFTGLGLSDLAVYDVPTGSFLYQTTRVVSTLATSVGPLVLPFGTAGAGQTIPAVADYQGIGLSQFAAYFPTYGIYAVSPTPTSPGVFMQFGMAGAGMSIPVPADYYGTGRAEVAVYMPSIAAFAIMAGDGQPGRVFQFGIPGAGQSIPAPADYYNTGQDDVAVYLAAQGAFAILAPGAGSGMIVPFGKPGLGQSIPVPGDYDGSGKTELAVYVPSLGAYFYRPANGEPDVKVPIGVAGVGEVPAPGDYDGSGRTEVAIYDPNGGFFEYLPAIGGPAVITFLGRPNGSIPVTEPIGALSEFAAPSGSSSNAIRAAFTAESVSATSSTTSAAITLSPASALPSGPTLASIRVPRLLVNQASSPEPWEASVGRVE